MSRVFALLAALFFISFIAPAARAQTVSSTTATIAGTVTDETKASMPGVTITITSPAMMGVQSQVTDAEGHYRFVGLTPGTYRMVFELPGFQTVIREDIRVTLGFTATINVSMSISALETAITVVGDSPVVDTQSTKISTNYDQEKLASIPNSRDFASVMAATPAVKVARIDVGGSQAMTEQTYRAYGMSGQDRPMVEGMLASQNTQILFYVDYGSFQEVNVGTAGHTAEMPGSGVFTTFISKSGGNQFKGSLYTDYYNKNFGTRNIDDELIATGITGGSGVDVRDINRVNRFQDFNVDGGGYVKKDVLWYYGSYRRNTSEVAQTNFPVKPQYTRVSNFTGKLTYQLSQNNKIVGYINRNSKVQPDRFRAFRLGSTTAYFNDDVSTTNQTGFPVGVWKLEYNRTIGSSAFYEARGGQYFYNWINEGKTDALRYEDIGSNVATGGAAPFNRWRRRPQFLTSLSWYKPSPIGSHQFKFGFEKMSELYYDNQGAWPESILHITNNGVPTEVYQFLTPNEGRTGLHTTSAYVTDTWRLGPRVTANVGFRFDRYTNFIPEQTTPVSRFNPTEIHYDRIDPLISFNNWAPRAGATWDVLGDGKTVAKYNFGIYRDSPGVELFVLNPGEQYRRYQWSDLNGNGRYEIGEEGTLIQLRGLNNETTDPNYKMARTLEHATFLERQIAGGFGVRTGMVYRKYYNGSVLFDQTRPYEEYNVPVMINDPGPDGRLNTADDGAPIAAFNLNPALIGTTGTNVRTYRGGQASDYVSWEIAATKRMRHNWSLDASYANTWSRLAVQAVNSTNPNPDDMLFAEPDGRRHFSNWQAKIGSSIDLPHGVRISPLLRMESGTPFARQITASFNYGTKTIITEPWGTRRTDTLFVADIRAEKKWSMFGHHSVGTFLDLFNITNSNTVTDVVQTAGASFLRPTRIISPFISRIGVKIEW